MGWFKKSILTFVAAFAVMACQSQNTPEGYRNVNPEVFEAGMKASKNAIILDVRTPGEVAEGVIPGAIVIDFYDPQFAQKVAQLDKKKEVYVYCRSGARSGSAMDVLKKAGFKNVTNLSGGILAWLRSGRKTQAK
jgi:rhodanese-related sulfurtransferase